MRLSWREKNQVSRSGFKIFNIRNSLIQITVFSVQFFADLKLKWHLYYAAKIYKPYYSLFAFHSLVLTNCINRIPSD